LGALAVKAAIERAGVSPSEVEECILGNVLSAGLGQAPARQAAIYGGLPVSTICTTLNKMCASGMKSVMYGAQGIMLGQAETILTGVGNLNLKIRGLKACPTLHMFYQKQDSVTDLETELLKIPWSRTVSLIHFLTNTWDGVQNNVQKNTNSQEKNKTNMQLNPTRDQKMQQRMENSKMKSFQFPLKQRKEQLMSQKMKNSPTSTLTKCHL
jgi:hypothetical protein